MSAMNSNIILSNYSNNTIDQRSLTDVAFSSSFQFWFTLTFHIPSVICYFFVLTYILTEKTQRKAIHNHSIIVLHFIGLSMVLFDYSWTIDSIRRGEVWPQVPILCEILWIFDFGFYDACTAVLAWTSFERHILIFHSNLIATKRRLILIHYIPLIIILIYLSIFYIYAIFFPSCENTYDFTLPNCGAYPCFISIPYLSQITTIFHGIIATFLICLFNLTLLMRVIRQKYLQHQNWKKCRKMALQVLSISVLFLSINFPYMTITLVQSIGYSEWGIDVQVYLFFFSSLVQYLLPFISVTHFPGIWQKMKMIITRNHQRVMPVGTFQLTTYRPR